MLERERRIRRAMFETCDQLVKATKKRNDTIKCIEMDEVEDKAWTEYLRQDEARVNQLENHMAKLKGMLKELGVA